MSDTAAQRNYKSTLNLPKTAFPMRANLAQNEPASVRRWNSQGVYAQILRRRESAPRFVFHDGPPYANGSIHVGHLLNKVLKDIVVRSRLMSGMHCAYIPGWDCHGLPIEHRVLTDLAERGKLDAIERLDDDTRRMAIRRACREAAEKFVRHQSGQMQRLLTLADYDNPYLTMDGRYEAEVLEVFAGMLEGGVVYRALKPVHWSIANQTALAEAELEYEDRRDEAVFVDFEADDMEKVGAAFGVELDQRPSFMIWTTTPWTLPANLAIAVHPRIRYALVRVDGNITVIADDLVERVTGIAKAESIERLAAAEGSALVGLLYRHPFCSRTGRIVAAEYVTTEDGTGLVHTAPGHGSEDFQTGLREGLDVYCPVRADGTYDDTVPPWLRGMNVFAANEVVIEHLRKSGHLFHAHELVHSYPHDWRSRTPVIFRSTEQWFVSVDGPVRGREASLRSMAISAARQRVRFVPEWGRNRMCGMLESRPDWCLSRQRAWGLPIPAFTMADGSVLMTPASVRAVALAFAARGSDAWFQETPAQLLEGYDIAGDPDAPAGADIASLQKMYDIFDVWFESGSSWQAVIAARGHGFPSDLYLEGSDQHRGWFQLSLLPALANKGEAPYRTLLTHGFMVDRDGRKMSKSGGNALDVDELLKHHGADVCRWWVSSLAYENDIKVDPSFFEQAGESYRKVRNTLRFLLSNLSDFSAEHRVATDALPEAGIDAWLLGELARLDAAARTAYERYELRRLHQLLYDFCNETLSAVYCVAVKDRLYCDRADAPRRRATQTVMEATAQVLVRLLAPIMPHTADEAMQALCGDGEMHCVHLESFAAPPPCRVSPKWPAVFAMRELALKALEDAKQQGIENPLDAELVLPDPDGALAPFVGDLPDLLGVSRVRADRSGDRVIVHSLAGEPRCERSWKRDGTVRRRADGGMLSDRDAEAVGTE